MNWRAVLQDAIAQNMYAKGAKVASASASEGLLHVLHTDFADSRFRRLGENSAEIGLPGVTRRTDSSDPPEPGDKPGNFEELTRASKVLSRAGVRLMHLPDGDFVGVWRDRDGPELRSALRVILQDDWPIRHLDGDAIPLRFKVRRIPRK